MARTKGTANLAASLEVLAGAPLDSRTVVPTVADLTVAANFPYKYVGMPVVVQATGDMYILTANDVTVAANWKKVNGSGGSGGHTIEDNGTAMTARAGLNFTDFDVSDDSTNDETDVKAHRLTAEEMEDIIYKVPSLANMSQLGTEAMIFSTSEKAVGQWTDGKIVYQKVIDANIISQSNKKYIQHNIQNIGDYKRVVSVMFPISNNVYSPCRVSSNDAFQSLINDSEIEFSITSSWASNFTRAIVIVQYTKTTDTALATGERFAGLTASGEVKFKKTVNVDSLLSAAIADSSEWKYLNHGISNLGKVVDYDFIAYNGSNTCIHLPYCYTHNNVDYCAPCQITPTQIGIWNCRGAINGFTTGYCDIYYTKTS